MEMKLRPRRTQKLKSTHRKTHRTIEKVGIGFGETREKRRLQSQGILKGTEDHQLTH
jgi:hypothetical protein